MIRCLARRSTRSDSFKRSCRVSRLTRERTPKSQFGKHRRPTMGNDVAKKPENELCNLDGFDGFTDETEGEDEQSSGSLIVGTKIKFDEAQVWVDSNGKKLPAGLELVFIKVRRVVRKWDRTTSRSKERLRFSNRTRSGLISTRSMRNARRASGMKRSARSGVRTEGSGSSI